MFLNLDKHSASPPPHPSLIAPNEVLFCNSLGMLLRMMTIAQEIGKQFLMGYIAQV